MNIGDVLIGLAAVIASLGSAIAAILSGMNQKHLAKLGTPSNGKTTAQVVEDTASDVSSVVSQIGTVANALQDHLNTPGVHNQVVPPPPAWR